MIMAFGYYEILVREPFSLIPFAGALWSWSQDPCSSWKTVLSLTDKPVPSEFSAHAWKSTVAASFLGNSHARVMGTHHKMEQKTRQKHRFVDFLKSFGETR